MEIHHPHSHVPKKLKEYILEFFMLFFAVTLGFLAENLREHMAESKKEKEYIISLTDDLKKDTADIREVKHALLKAIHREDTLISTPPISDWSRTSQKCFKGMLHILSCSRTCQPATCWYCAIQKQMPSD